MFGLGRQNRRRYPGRGLREQARQERAVRPRRQSCQMVVLVLLVIAVIVAVIFYSVKYLNRPLLVHKYYTEFEEMEMRRELGFLDNMPISKLIHCTEFLSRPKFQCVDGTRAVILVQSACNHQVHRESIRQTWGEAAEFAGIFVFFFLGQCPENKEDIESHKDIFQADFVDSYFNNTLKTLTRLKWFARYCTKADYVIMTDDDAVIIVPLLIQFLEEGMGPSIVGPYYPKGAHVFRDKKSKWYVPTWVYENSTYPAYVGGGTFIISGAKVLPLVLASYNFAYMTVDDVFFNGIVAESIGLKRVADQRFPRQPVKSFGCDSNSTIASQGYEPLEIVMHWENWMEKCGRRRHSSYFTEPPTGRTWSR